MNYIINNEHVNNINLISGPGEIIGNIYQYKPTFDDSNLGEHTITIELLGSFGSKI